MCVSLSEESKRASESERERDRERDETASWPTVCKVLVCVFV